MRLTIKQINNADLRLKCGERRKFMANINTTNTRKNVVEIYQELAKNGALIEYIVINGQKVGILGSVSEKDRHKAIEAIQMVLDASGGNVYETIQKLNTIATMTEHDIEPDEMIKVRGKDIIISYNERAAYTTDGRKIANCDGLPIMPHEAVKAVLTARVEALR
jgi:hypothetical protein